MIFNIALRQLKKFMTNIMRTEYGKQWIWFLGTSGKNIIKKPELINPT